jgi:hypothetical protein
MHTMGLAKKHDKEKALTHTQRTHIERAAGRLGAAPARPEVEEVLGAVMERLAPSAAAEVS